MRAMITYDINHFPMKQEIMKSEEPYSYVEKIRGKHVRNTSRKYEHNR